jgi:pseudouridine-5'-monophosphatase
VRIAPPTHVIFDLDGTLLDTEPLYTLAAQHVVGRFGKIYDWSTKRLIVGGDPLLGARLVVERLQLPISAEAYLHEREAVMRELCRTVAARPGAERLVAALAARKVPLAIGTSSARELCELKLASQLMAAHFQVIVCSDDPEVRAAKPAPDIFLLAASRLAAQPENCLVIEDTPKGVQAALAAGMQVIVIPDSHMRDEDYSGALCVLESLEQLTLAQLGL